MICKTFSRVMIVATVVTALMLPASQAGAADFFFDVGDLAAGVQGGPLDNSNPQVCVAPGGTVSLHLWAIPDGDDNKVIAALGHDVLMTGSASSSITATQYTLDNPMIGDNPRWNGVALAGGLNDGGKLVSDQRAVFVPIESPFVGGIGSGNLGVDPGFDPESGAVYLGELVLQAAADAQLGDTAELRLAVSPLLIAQVTTGTWTEEEVSFGFTAAGSESADGSGSVVGASSATADATIVIGTGDDCGGVSCPADFDGDGEVDAFDLAFVLGFWGPCDGDCPADLDDSGAVGAFDLALLLGNWGPCE